MRVKEVMSRNVIKIKSGSSFRQVADVLAKNKISGAPVVGKRGELIGVISEKDLFAALYPNFMDIVGDIAAWFDMEKREYKLGAKGEIIVDSIMSKKVLVCHPDDSILDAGSKMIANQVHRLIVVNENKKIIGIVTRRDIFNRILKNYLKNA